MPRIAFLTAAGEPLDVTSGSAKYPHYFSDAGSIAIAMRKALGIVGVPAPAPEVLRADGDAEL